MRSFRANTTNCNYINCNAGVCPFYLVSYFTTKFKFVANKEEKIQLALALLSAAIISNNVMEKEQSSVHLGM